VSRSTRRSGSCRGPPTEWDGAARGADDRGTARRGRSVAARTLQPVDADRLGEQAARRGAVVHQQAHPVRDRRYAQPGPSSSGCPPAASGAGRPLSLPPARRGGRCRCSESSSRSRGNACTCTGSARTPVLRPGPARRLFSKDDLGCGTRTRVVPRRDVPACPSALHGVRPAVVRPQRRVRARASRAGGVDLRRAGRGSASG
jgi:hypothetical protein